MNLFTKSFIPLSMLILLSAETPHEGEYAEMLLTAEEKELDDLAKEFVQLDSSAELQELIEQKVELEQKFEELKTLEQNIKEYHKIFKNIKLNYKSLKKECDYNGCENILRYSLTNNSDINITDVAYRITIKHKGKIVHISTFKSGLDRVILPGAHYSGGGNFKENNEMYDMVIPKGASISLTLVAVQVNFKDWYEDPYEEYNHNLALLKEKQKENSNAIKQYHISVDARKKEITKRITQLKQQEAAHVSFEQ